MVGRAPAVISLPLVAGRSRHHGWKLAAGRARGRARDPPSGSLVIGFAPSTTQERGAAKNGKALRTA